MVNRALFRFGVVTLFPEMFAAVTKYGVVGRAFKQGLLSLEMANPRDYAQDRHRSVDARPYGGGPGMLMKAPPVCSAIKFLKAQMGQAAQVAYLSPQGRPLCQDQVISFAHKKKLILLAGRYEGVDERVIELEVDMELSIGDYVVSGGELPAMMLMDAVARYVPGVLGDFDSTLQESFTFSRLGCPRYTRPSEFEGLQVPQVLMSGDHRAVSTWCRRQRLKRTYARRPDLLERSELSAEEQKWLTSGFLESDDGV